MILLEDCNIGMEVSLRPGFIFNTTREIEDDYPNLVGVIGDITPSNIAPIKVNPGGWWFKLNQ
ncbi:hypothetical protein KKH23_08640, partial [Patescibacteria group bacterium]|nr:hypothetical protein [Patescibacteria group bacterium]